LWLNNNQFPPYLNYTNIPLIPKGSELKSMKDWQKIALCNVLYKLLARVLVNQLKHDLHKCKSANQSNFVRGHSILDNATVDMEVVHHMKVSKRIKAMNVALKLALRKAYDRINWLYLKDLMLKWGFLLNGCDGS
jgi:hypothetical protein